MTCKVGRPTALTDEKKETFLQALMDKRSIKAACEQIGISRWGLRYHLLRDSEFRSWVKNMTQETRMERAYARAQAKGKEVRPLAMLRILRPELYDRRVRRGTNSEA